MWLADGSSVVILEYSLEPEIMKGAFNAFLHQKKKTGKVPIWAFAFGYKHVLHEMPFIKLCQHKQEYIFEIYEMHLLNGLIQCHYYQFWGHPVWSLPPNSIEPCQTTLNGKAYHLVPAELI